LWQCITCGNALLAAMHYLQQCITCGDALLVAMHYSRRCITCDDALLAAMHYLWRCITCVDALLVAMHYLQQCITRGNALLVAMPRAATTSFVCVRSNSATRTTMFIGARTMRGEDCPAYLGKQRLVNELLEAKQCVKRIQVLTVDPWRRQSYSLAISLASKAQFFPLIRFIIRASHYATR
jgi:hypothetical protein